MTLTRTELEQAYNKRKIPVNSRMTKQQLLDGYKSYNVMMRKILEELFSESWSCTDNSEDWWPETDSIYETNRLKNGLRDDVIHFDMNISFLKAEVKYYTSMYRLIKFYQKKIPMGVRDCTISKMGEYMIKQIERFERAFMLPAYPKQRALDLLKKACPPVSRNPQKAEEELEYLEDVVLDYKYYRLIKPYIN